MLVFVEKLVSDASEVDMVVGVNNVVLAVLPLGRSAGDGKEPGVPVISIWDVILILVIYESS